MRSSGGVSRRPVVRIRCSTDGAEAPGRSSRLDWSFVPTLDIGEDDLIFLPDPPDHLIVVVVIP